MRSISISQEKEKNKKSSVSALSSCVLPIANLKPREIGTLYSLIKCPYLEIFFSQQTIADFCDRSVSTIKRSLEGLRKARFIVDTKQRHNNSNIYTLNPLLQDPTIRHWVRVFFLKYFPQPIINLLSKARSVASGLLSYLNNKIIYLFTTKVRDTYGGLNMIKTHDEEREKNIVFNADGIPICFDSSYHQVEWKKIPTTKKVRTSTSSFRKEKPHNRKNDYQSAYNEPGGLSRYTVWTPPPAPQSCTNQEFKEIIEQVTDPAQLAFLKIMSSAFGV